MSGMSEHGLEQTCLGWFAELGWGVRYGPELDPEAVGSERDDHRQVFLVSRLREGLARINPEVSGAGIEEAVRRILAVGGPDRVISNRDFHSLLTDGVDVEVAAAPGGRGGARYLKVRLLDLDDPDKNDWLVL